MQVLPINDTQVFHMWWDSYPYSAISVFALHPIYLSLPALVKGRGPHGFMEAVEAARRKHEQIDMEYEGTLRDKLRLARTVFDSPQGRMCALQHHLECCNVVDAAIFHMKHRIVLDMPYPDCYGPTAKSAVQAGAGIWPVLSFSTGWSSMQCGSSRMLPFASCGICLDLQTIDSGASCTVTHSGTRSASPLLSNRFIVICATHTGCSGIFTSSCWRRQTSHGRSV